MPNGREVSFADFQRFFAPYRRNYAYTHSHALYEEFRGVLLASPEGPLSEESYMALGVRQSLYSKEQRPQVHALFRRYLAFLEQEGLYDPSHLAHRYRGQLEPTYDFVVVDEVQDLTLAQVDLLLGALKSPGQFLLAGDSHQIVHPNFFSWAALKSYFFREEHQALERVTILRGNFRNAKQVSLLANRLLKLKQARFGSVDRESTYLVEPKGEREGRVMLLKSEDGLLQDLNRRTRESVEVAVLVLREEDKERARSRFSTPLVFSVREAKGLEYAQVVLYDFVSRASEAYQEIARGVAAEDLEVEGLTFRRAKDKSDKSLEEYKFFTNALYVALTRAVEEVVWLEEEPWHPFLRLLGLEAGRELTLKTKTASREDWAREAARLTEHGNLEQARAIRETFLKEKPVPWKAMDQERLSALLEGLGKGGTWDKARKELFEFALFHHNLPVLSSLSEAGYPPAQEVLQPWKFGRLRKGSEVAQEVQRRLLKVYEGRGWKEILWDVKTYGTEFRTPIGATPLMLAARAGNQELLEALLKAGADPEARDLFGFTPFLYALERALLEPEFAQKTFSGVWERLAPTAVDVQVEGHLVRLYPNMSEYWVFLSALALLKSLRGLWVFGSQFHPRSPGISAGQLAVALGHLSPALLPSTLARKDNTTERRTYLSSVLSRSEVESSYRPARCLFLRRKRGYYLPNPGLLLRVVRQGEETWQPLPQAFNFDLMGLPALLTLA